MGLGEIAQWAKHLPRKFKDVSLIPSTVCCAGLGIPDEPCQLKLDVIVQAYNSSTREAETRGSL